LDYKEFLIMSIRYTKFFTVVATCSAFATPLNAQNIDSTNVSTKMSDAAMQGVGCLALATPALAAAYAVGPTEIMMLVTGAVIVPSSASQLLISLGGILGGAACGVGAAITPNVLWILESLQQEKSSVQNTLAPNNLQPVAEIAPTAVAESTISTNEDMVQGWGCLAGVIGISALTLATAPVEIVGLSAGGVTVPTNSPILFLGMAGTVVPAGCTIGAAASLPMLVLSRNLGLDAIGQAIASLFNWNYHEPAQLSNSKAKYIEANVSAIEQIKGS